MSGWALQETRPVMLALLDVAVDAPEWQALDPPQRRWRIIEGVKRLLLQQCQVQPLLVVIENLHWIDAGTQAVLDSLIEGLPAAVSYSSSAIARGISTGGRTRGIIRICGSTHSPLRPPRSCSTSFWGKPTSCCR